MNKTIKVRVNTDQALRAMENTPIPDFITLEGELVEEQSLSCDCKHPFGPGCKAVPVKEPATAREKVEGLSCPFCYKHHTEDVYSCGCPCHRSQPEKGEYDCGCPIQVMPFHKPSCNADAPKEISEEDLDKSIDLLLEELPVPEPIEYNISNHDQRWLIDKINEILAYLRHKEQ